MAQNHIHSNQSNSIQASYDKIKMVIHDKWWCHNEHVLHYHMYMLSLKTLRYTENTYYHWKQVRNVSLLSLSVKNK